MREALFALLLAAAAACVVVGVGHWSRGAAWITAGAAIVSVAWLILGGEHDSVPAEVEP